MVYKFFDMKIGSRAIATTIAGVNTNKGIAQELQRKSVLKI